ncbi:hypothetical protein [Streptomyces neyagawaensis]|uniref:hypothetical protein n=1 Tax=Streptomyces neyagawaensis TaxID=42238 RepID=UPI0006E22EF1|nr:hypothetical protein [Streptomyces neyagawaensis]MCL6738006.1 hypothetical protein [Streptomyces neyagawaensis]MDE1688311.1 hypothetical protein [Streptomyces neyagawaensis]
MAVSKIKMSNARRALIEAGMSRTMARGALRLLDLSEPLKPQIVALAEEDPELFGLDADGNPLPDDDDAEDDTPMTAREAVAARLKGGSQHIQRKTYRRTAEPRPSTASKSAQENAAHLRKNSTRNTPPAQQWREPVRDINAGHVAPAERPKDSSADRLANRLRGN